ncbi:MAG: hypothetical protein K2L49_08330 [Muribaculaceae bacterium]|nr:hypothetical protein [Muribaculaceae bacterium]
MVAFESGAEAPVDQRTDSIVRSHQVIFFGDGEKPEPDSVTSRIYEFYYDQFRHFQDPLAPYFLFMSKDANLAMGVGGCVRMRGWYDWGGAVPTTGFAPYMIPITPDPLKMRDIGTSPAGTALFFRVLGRNKKLGSYQLYIETNFNGYASRDFHLKKAYAMLNDWTVGYTNSTFSDPGALPPTVDAQGPNCKMSATSVLVRWMHAFRHGWSMAASVETPSDQIDVDGISTAKVDQYLPDVAAFVQREWGYGRHVRLAAVARTLSYRDLLAGRNHNVVGWGVQLSSVLRPADPVTVYAAFNGGCGYAGLGGDWIMGNYDLIGDPDRPGRMKAPGAYGGYAAIQYNFTSSLFVSATFGGARYLSGRSADPDEYKYGLYGAANLFWDLTPRIQLGAELNVGKRENVDGASRWARRIGAVAQFSF